MANNSTNQWMEFLPADRDTALSSSAIGNGIITACRVKSTNGGIGYIKHPVIEDAFQVAVQQRSTGAHFWVDGRYIEATSNGVGSFSFFDYRSRWEADLDRPFESINFHIPMIAASAIEEEIGPNRLANVEVRPGTFVNDPVVEGLARALLPAFNDPSSGSQLFFDRISIALTLHLAATYGDAPSARLDQIGALANSKMSRALEFMSAHLHEGMSLAEVSSACGMSAPSFLRAFKLSTGMTPHQWVVGRRIEIAKQLLEATRLPLNEVSLKSGFTSQSHFSKSFYAKSGMTPREWRKHFE